MKPILYAILSGLLLILCFPGFDQGYLAWFAMVPLMLAIKGKGLKAGFGLCTLAGMVSNPGIFYWFKLVRDVGWIEFLILDVYLSFCYLGTFGLVFSLISKRTRLPAVVTAPVLWVLLEYGRSYAGILSHPQMLMGHSQHLYHPIIQVSAFTGVYGISFLIIMVNAAVCEAILHPKKALRQIVVTLTVLVVSLVYGSIVITGGHGDKSVNVTVVQGNINRNIKWHHRYLRQNLETYLRLSREALNNDKTSLLVWPETAIGGSLRYELYLSRAISGLAMDSGTHILFGSSQSPKAGSNEFRRENLYNSAFLISPEGRIEDQYNKIHLLPFAEYLPYRDFFLWPAKFVSGAAKYVTGTDYTIFNLDEARFGTLICWESLYPDLFRQFVKRGADFMINITNEDRLEDTAAPYQMTAINVFRAVENRVALVRCGNTGISCFIDMHGRIMGSVKDNNNRETFIEGYLTKEIPLLDNSKSTFYTVYGDVFIYMNFIIMLFMSGLCFWKGRYSVHETQGRTR